MVLRNNCKEAVLSSSPSSGTKSKTSSNKKSEKKAAKTAERETNLKSMEALLRHSTSGIHALFDNAAIAKVFSEVKDEKDFHDFSKMKLVQDCMTELISKKSINEKMYYIHSLEVEKFEMLVRSYFHIVENTIKSTSELTH